MRFRSSSPTAWVLATGWRRAQNAAAVPYAWRAICVAETDLILLKEAYAAFRIEPQTMHLRALSSELYRPHALDSSMVRQTNASKRPSAYGPPLYSRRTSPIRNFFSYFSFFFFNLIIFLLSDPFYFIILLNKNRLTDRNLINKNIL